MRVATPAVAIRGTNKIMVHRILQETSSGVDKEQGKEKKVKEDKTKEPSDDKTEKEPKEDIVEKEPKEASDKSSKKEKKVCKKATTKEKKIQQETRRYRRLQVTDIPDKEQDVFEGEIEDLPYCSQGKLSIAQCATLANVPSDGKFVSALKLELIHNDEKHPKTIAEEAEQILDSVDTKSRFVGCKDMDAPPPSPTRGDSKKQSIADDNNTRHRRARRNSVIRIHRQLPTDDHEISFRSANEEIDVIGVDFRNLEISRGGE